MLLVLIISQSYPVWDGPPPSPSGWQLRTQRLTFEPDGQLSLTTTRVTFVVHKGQISLVTYYLPDQVNSQTTQMSEGQTFSTNPGSRYILNNRQKTPVELIMIQVFAPGTANLPTPTPRPVQNRGYNFQLLEQRVLDTAPGREELEEMILTSHINLLKRG